MNEVIVNGVRYVPDSGSSAPPVGIAVTTHNRQDVLDRCLAAVRENTPDSFPVVVVDDGSATPATVPSWARLIRHDSPQGIPAAKNRCLAELDDLGCRDVFLFDDDTWPAAPGWWKPYVDSPEPHLQYSWLRFAKDKRPVENMAEVYRDSGLVGYTHSMGCMLYVTRSVLDRVGGLHPGFGAGMEEHIEWSRRINSAGLTTFAHQDVPDSGALIHAGDEFYEVKRSIPAGDRQQLLERNQRLRDELDGWDGYVEFRPRRNVILSTYLTSGVDVQRGKKMPRDGSMLAPLVNSVRAHGADMVLLHDIGDACPSGVESVPVEAPLTAYTQRWISQWQWLRDHPEVDRVWMVDATDTELLRDPWAHLREDALYCGWEPTVLGCDWIRTHTPPNLLAWVDENRDRMLLNTGVVGGDRRTVMSLCRGMIDAWALSPREDPLQEMCFYNYVVYSAADAGNQIVTGPAVTTLFKANEKQHPTAIWRHK